MLAWLGLRTAGFMRTLKVRMRVSGAPGFPVFLLYSTSMCWNTKDALGISTVALRDKNQQKSFPSPKVLKYCSSKCSWFETMMCFFLNHYANNQQNVMFVALASIVNWYGPTFLGSSWNFYFQGTRPFQLKCLNVEMVVFIWGNCAIENDLETLRTWQCFYCWTFKKKIKELQVQFDGTVKASCSLNSDMISSCAGARQHPRDMCSDQLRCSLCMF